MILPCHSFNTCLMTSCGVWGRPHDAPPHLPSLKALTQLLGALQTDSLRSQPLWGLPQLQRTPCQDHAPFQHSPHPMTAGHVSSFKDNSERPELPRGLAEAIMDLHGSSASVFSLPQM